MTKEEFAEAVSQVSDRIESLPINHSILSCACIESVCNIAIREDKIEQTVEKLREVANLLEKELILES